MEIVGSFVTSVHCADEMQGGGKSIPANSVLNEVMRGRNDDGISTKVFWDNVDKGINRLILKYADNEHALAEDSAGYRCGVRIPVRLSPNDYIYHHWDEANVIPEPARGPTCEPRCD